MLFKDLIDDLARAIGFLSRLPVSARFFADHDGSMRRTARAFPAAGFVILAPVGLVFAALCNSPANVYLAAFVCVLAQVLLTGGLHEDGLADTADGLGGGKDREKALAIMKDSRIGAYGALALIFSIGLRVTAIGTLATMLTPMDVALCLMGIAAASRGLMVWHWHALRAARTNGVAASLGGPDAQSCHTALFSGLTLAIITIGPGAGLQSLAAMLITISLAAFAYNQYITKKLGGYTGDTLGAMQQLTEIIALLALVFTL